MRYIFRVFGQNTKVGTVPDIIRGIKEMRLFKKSRRTEPEKGH